MVPIKGREMQEEAMGLVMHVARESICHGTHPVPITYQELKERTYHHSRGRLNTVAIEGAIWSLRLKKDLLESRPGELTMVCKPEPAN
jgi:hypothetical protein